MNPKNNLCNLNVTTSNCLNITNSDHAIDFNQTVPSFTERKVSNDSTNSELT